MSSRVAASIAYATGFGEQMVVHSRDDYEDRAVALAASVSIFTPQPVSNESTPEALKASHLPHTHRNDGELLDLRRRLFLTRDSMPLFDTARWTRNLEKAYNVAWKRWVDGSQFRLGEDEEMCIRVKDEDETFVPLA